MYSVQPQHFSGNVIYGIAFVVSCAFASVFLAIASFVCVRYLEFNTLAYNARNAFSSSKPLL